MSEQTREIVDIDIIDHRGNTLITVNSIDNKINASNIIIEMITKLSKMSASISILEGTVADLQSDLADHKEAFEHAEDSLQNIRYTVSAVFRPPTENTFEALRQEQ